MEDKNIFVPLGWERMRVGGAGGVRAWMCVEMKQKVFFVFFSVNVFLVCLCVCARARLQQWHRFWAKLPGKKWQKVQITSWRQLLQTTCCEVKNISPHLFVAVFTPARSLKTTLQAFVSVHAAVKTCVAELKIAKLMSSKNIHISTCISDLKLKSFIYLWQHFTTNLSALFL